MIIDIQHNLLTVKEYKNFLFQWNGIDKIKSYETRKRKRNELWDRWLEKLNNEKRLE
jgi:hypothetical protein